MAPISKGVHTTHTPGMMHRSGRTTTGGGRLAFAASRSGVRQSVVGSTPTTLSRSQPFFLPTSFPDSHFSSTALSMARNPVVEETAIKVVAKSNKNLFGKLSSGAAAGLASRPSKNTAIVAVAALLIGFLIGKWRGRTASRIGRLSTLKDGDTDIVEAALSSPAIIVDDELTDEGANPMWLNYALGRMWALFQKNTKQLIEEVIQPVLDDTERPDFVKSIRLVSFSPGKRAPYVRSVKRLPSRALAEVQYSFQALFASTSEFTFEVDIELSEKLRFSVPVKMKNMDLDASCWSAFSLAPYEPYVKGVQYSLLEFPEISFDLTLADVIPITAVPVLRSLFFRIITQEIPKEFVYPKTVYLDFNPPSIDTARNNIKTTRLEEIEYLSPEELRRFFPEQWALYDSMDLNNDGSLSSVELFSGLKDWGYTAADASESFRKLDSNADGRVTFVEFCKMWPELAASFVPNRYQGLLTLYVRNAGDISVPLLGSSDPIVKLRLGEQEVVSKRDSKTSGKGKAGAPVWNEVFELYCGSPADEELEIVIQEGSFLASGLRGGKEIGSAKVRLASLAKRRNQQFKVKLEPEGYLMLDLSYADFVDRRGPL